MEDFVCLINKELKSKEEFIMYSELQLVRIAKRENNNKRSYLVVNSMQAKHIPVSPHDAFKMFDELAAKVGKAYTDEKLLIIGFAETATAIGARMAVSLNAMLMQTTREDIKDVEYLYFSESHSHATEQKVIKDDLDSIINDVDRIVFAEDEVTTGNTIMKIVNIIKSIYGDDTKFAVASLLNGMDSESLKIYEDNRIDIHYLVKTDHSGYGDIAEKYICDGQYYDNFSETDTVSETVIGGYVNARRITEGGKYQQACEELWKSIYDTIMTENGNNEGTGKQEYLVLGTEECMYPAIFVASQLEKLGYNTKCHSTTRSPIAVSSNQEYPLHERYQLRSMYNEDRTTFIYNLKKYDRVIIVTDAPDSESKGARELVAALKMKDNKNIQLFRWR